MLSPPDSPNESVNPMTQLLQSIFSDNSNVMLAALISLLLVILFVLVLHIYAKWFLAQAQVQARRRRRRTSVTVSHVLGPGRFHHFHTFHLEDPTFSTSTSKGLDSTTIASIPLFVYEAEETGEYDPNGILECVICLSAFEEGEIGRNLPKCGHAFHVECIDMWLNSHSNCPICRAPVGAGTGTRESDPQMGSIDGEEQPSSLMEIVIDSTPMLVSDTNESDPANTENGRQVNDSASETSSSLLGCSLKKMLSKVFPSSNVDELSARE